VITSLNTSFGSTTSSLGATLGQGFQIPMLAGIGNLYFHKQVFETLFVRLVT
jgi:hypothetical protein